MRRLGAPRVATESSLVNESSLTVEPLGPHHDRASFSCGESSLDHYIRRRASQDVRRRVARVFVASASPPEQIVGYYTLSAVSFERDKWKDFAARSDKEGWPASRFLASLAEHEIAERERWW